MSINTNNMKPLLTHFFKLSCFQLICIVALCSFTVVSASDEYPVGLTPDLPFASVLHQGKPVKIKRVQDTKHRLVDDFAKTSRPCPPFCIHPMSAAPGVDTVGELELINFVNNQVKDGKGLLIDARMPKFFNSETIPGAINIPFIIFTGDNANKVISLLGVKIGANGSDFSQAKELCLFCNGPWCDQSPRAIKALIKAGYPAKKLKYYRGGMQLWKNFSLTTVLPKANTVDGGSNDG